MASSLTLREVYAPGPGESEEPLTAGSEGRQSGGEQDQLHPANQKMLQKCPVGPASRPWHTKLPAVCVQGGDGAAFPECNSKLAVILKELTQAKRTGWKKNPAGQIREPGGPLAPCAALQAGQGQAQGGLLRRGGQRKSWSRTPALCPIPGQRGSPSRQEMSGTGGRQADSVTCCYVP